jgi:hypothetical protein
MTWDLIVTNRRYARGDSGFRGYWARLQRWWRAYPSTRAAIVAHLPRLDLRTP